MTGQPRVDTTWTDLDDDYLAIFGEHPDLEQDIDLATVTVLFPSGTRLTDEVADRIVDDVYRQARGRRDPRALRHELHPLLPGAPRHH